MRKALGRGLEALLPGAPTEPAQPQTRDRIPLAEIRPNPDQPRRHFEEAALESLAQSIRRRGLLQPLVVRRVDGGYELIAGERRLRAAQRAGLDVVPVVVREAGPQERLEIALIENLQREDLTPLEEAEAYRHLIEVYALTQDEVAQAVGKSRPAVANAIRLLSLPDAVKAQLEGGELSAGHARAVLSIDGQRDRIEFARELVADKATKGEAERRAQARRTRETRPGAPTRRRAEDPHWRSLAEELTRALGTRVRLHPRARGGTIEIEFYSEAELTRLVDRLRGAERARAF
ncbi:MAG TPA: ParB/RepB/Spo0J family partition protein [Candidatus Eisenbacteria bacterium]|nr:ParB/RepB/Spo0J family partition protein [Candidatus Eisenbacteria bacterium]